MFTYQTPHAVMYSKTQYIISVFATIYLNFICQRLQYSHIIDKKGKKAVSGIN